MAFSGNCPPHSVLKRVESIVLQICDETDGLREAMRAHACLVKLISPFGAQEDEPCDCTQGELRSLMRVLNDEVCRRVESLDAIAQEMRATLSTAEALI